LCKEGEKNKKIMNNYNGIRTIGNDTKDLVQREKLEEARDAFSFHLMNWGGIMGELRKSLNLTKMSTLRKFTMLWTFILRAHFLIWLGKDILKILVTKYCIWEFEPCYKMRNFSRIIFRPCRNFKLDLIVENEENVICQAKLNRIISLDKEDLIYDTQSLRLLLRKPRGAVKFLCTMLPAIGDRVTGNLWQIRKMKRCISRVDYDGLIILNEGDKVWVPALTQEPIVPNQEGFYFTLIDTQGIPVSNIDKDDSYIDDEEMRYSEINISSALANIMIEDYSTYNHSDFVYENTGLSTDDLADIYYQDWENR
jgi:hypothetical protein